MLSRTPCAVGSDGCGFCGKGRVYKLVARGATVRACPERDPCAAGGIGEVSLNRAARSAARGSFGGALHEVQRFAEMVAEDLGGDLGVAIDGRASVVPPQHQDALGGFAAGHDELESKRAGGRRPPRSSPWL